jgi:phosphoribosylformylglycinamidine synthase
MRGGPTARGLDAKCGLHFVCRHVNIRVENEIHHLLVSTSLVACSIPVAHAEGNYACDDATYSSLKKTGDSFSILRREREATDEANPNGARSNIAGICNQDRNSGMMPHPERACEGLRFERRTSYV